MFIPSAAAFSAHSIGLCVFKTVRANATAASVTTAVWVPTCFLLLLACFVHTYILMVINGCIRICKVKLQLDIYTENIRLNLMRHAQLQYHTE